jgi:prolyl-tRNA editing enzyme YbaK/EbsC (Cys-tRNA(Pro) deacylase)
MNPAKPAATSEAPNLNQCRDQIEAIMDTMRRIKMDQQALNEDIEAVAEKIGCKKAILRKALAIRYAEEAKGEALQQESDTLDLAEAIMGKS